VTDRTENADYKRNSRGHFGKGNRGGPGTTPRRRQATYQDKIPQLVKKIIDVIYDGSTDGDEWIRQIRRDDPAKFLTFTVQLMRAAEAQNVGDKELRGQYGVAAEIASMSDTELDAFIVTAAQGIKNRNPGEYRCISLTEARSVIKQQQQRIESMSSEIDELKAVGVRGPVGHCVAPAPPKVLSPSDQSARDAAIDQRRQALNEQRLLDSDDPEIWR